MTKKIIRSIVAVVLSTGSMAVLAQQPPAAGAPASQTIRLNVEVETKAGEPVGGLSQNDFKLLDNNAPQTMTSFKEVTLGQEPVEVILLIDAVNAKFDTAAFARDEVMRYLHSNGAKLPTRTTIAVLTDKGVKAAQGFSTDGNAVSEALTQNASGLREISRAAGFWGATERLQICLNAVREVGEYGAKLPGRKIVLWISPGWPLLTGPGIQLDGNQERQIFGEIVSISTQLREANVSIYNINPLGPGENLTRADYYQAYTKGVSKPNQTDIADLGLQVLSLQSGGLALQGSTDVAGEIERSLKDVKSWYEITFPAAHSEKPNEYHHIEVKVDKPGATARTRDGYYAQP